MSVTGKPSSKMEAFRYSIPRISIIGALFLSIIHGVWFFSPTPLAMISVNGFFFLLITFLSLAIVFFLIAKVFVWVFLRVSR